MDSSVFVSDDKIKTMLGRPEIIPKEEDTIGVLSSLESNKSEIGLPARPESVITTTSSVVSSSDSGDSSAEVGLTAYTMSGLYSKPPLFKTNSNPPTSVPTEPFVEPVKSGKSKTLPVSVSVHNPGRSGLKSTLIQCHRRQASTPVQLQLISSPVVEAAKIVKSAGHKRSYSYGHHKYPPAGTCNHRRTGSSVIETLHSLTCSSAADQEMRDNSITQFLEMLKKEQQSRFEQQELNDMQDELEDLRDCGIGRCRPGFMQSLSSIKVFVFLLSLLVTLQQALSSGYFNSVITTIEKRYEIPSSITGIIASMYEIGNVITVIFVSYLGSRRRIPVWIGMGVIIIGLGSITFSIPHFLTGRHLIKSDINGSSSNNMCRNPVVQPKRITEDLLIETLPGLENIKSLAEDLSNPPLAAHNNQYNRESNCIEEADESAALPIFIFMVSQLLLGCGGSPLFTLGTTYIDNHVKRDSSSMYIGVMYSMCAFGPVCGFLLGAYLLSHHVDTFTEDITNLNIDSDNRHWVGMWWGGFLICGALMLLISIPFFFFPKELKKEKVKVFIDEKYHHATDPSIRPTKVSVDTKPEPEVTENYGKDIKDIPRSTWKLLTNKIYIVTCLGACMELIIVSGFIVFLPKYLETQFKLTKSHASMFTGGVAIPGACIGIFFGGYILKRLQLRPKGAVQLVIFFNVLCLCCYAMLFFFGCENVKMAGTTRPYYDSNITEPFQINLTASCNFGCECDMNDVQPVCGANGLTYFSPCHAGCKKLEGSNNDNYTDCACVVHSEKESYHSLLSSSRSMSPDSITEVTMIPMATAGPCYNNCGMILPFMVLLFFMTLLVAVTQMPVLMVVLRSVEEEEKAFALGIQFVIFRIFGYIPSPILFGHVIDSTCLLWNSNCHGEAGGSCLLYDIEAFRYKYVGVCSVIKVLSVLIFLADWWLIRKRQNEEAKKSDALTVGEVVNSIISLDKLFEPDGPLWIKMVDSELGGEDSGNCEAITHENPIPVVTLETDPTR